MSRVTIKDKTFEVSMSEEQIKQRIREVAQQISHDMEGRNPLFLAVLNGAFIFAADLMREMTIPCEISFVKLASYQGTTSTGKIKEIIGINEDLSGRKRRDGSHSTENHGYLLKPVHSWRFM